MKKLLKKEKVYVIIAVLNILILVVSFFFLFLSSRKIELLEQKMYKTEKLLNYYEYTIKEMSVDSQELAYFQFIENVIFSIYSENRDAYNDLSPYQIRELISSLLKYSEKHEMSPFLPLAVILVNTDTVRLKNGDSYIESDIGEKSLFKMTDYQASQIYKKYGEEVNLNWHKSIDESVRLWTLLFTHNLEKVSQGEVTNLAIKEALYLIRKDLIKEELSFIENDAQLESYIRLKPSKDLENVKKTISKFESLRKDFQQYVHSIN